MNRLLVVTESLEVGGAERQALQVLSRLPEHFEAELVLLGKAGPLESELARLGVPYHRLPHSGGFDPSLLFRLTRLLRRHSHTAVEGLLHFSSMYACLAGRMVGTPVRVACNIGDRSLYKNDFAAKKQRLMKRIGYGAATRIFVNSHFMAAADPVLQSFRPKVRVIHNGLAEEAFHSPVTVQEIREELAIPANRQVMVMCGRLSAAKDFQSFLRILERCVGEGRDAHGIIVGDGPERSALESLATQLSLSDRVSFVGMVPDPRPYLAAGDVFVFTSRRESLPNAVLEAMALGLPVVAVATAGVPELVLDELTGSLHSAGDVDGMSASVQKLFAEDSLRRKWGQAGLHHARENFHWDARMGDYEALLTP